LERTDLGGFLKLTAVVYAAFFFALISYVMHLETTTGIGPRVSLLAMALFSTAVNLINASNALGTASGLTLVDKIHVMVLVYLLVAAIMTVASRVLLDRGGGGRNCWSEPSRGGAGDYLIRRPECAAHRPRRARRLTPTSHPVRGSEVPSRRHASPVRSRLTATSTMSSAHRHLVIRITND
jgi:hypothetical protein